MSQLGVEQKRVRIEVDIPKDMNDLIIGSPVDLMVHIDNRQDALLLPEEAIYQKNGKDFVTVVEDSKTIEREVTLGLESDYMVEILSGLSEGEVILLD